MLLHRTQSPLRKSKKSRLATILRNNLKQNVRRDHNVKGNLNYLQVPVSTSTRIPGTKISISLLILNSTETTAGALVTPIAGGTVMWK